MKHWWQQKTQRLIVENVGAGVVHAALIGALTITIVILYAVLTGGADGALRLDVLLA